MARDRFNPQDFGINMSKDDLTDMLLDKLSAMYRGLWTIDELLLHPLDAHRFCDEVRMEHGFYDAPDEVLLRPMINRRSG